MEKDNRRVSQAFCHPGDRHTSSIVWTRISTMRGSIITFSLFPSFALVQLCVSCASHFLKMPPMSYVALLLGSLVVPIYGASLSSSCAATLTPTNSVKPSIASGYQVALVATGLTKPRSIQFDNTGSLLVVEAGSGIVNLAFQDSGGTCLSVKSSKTVVKNAGVCVSCFTSWRLC